MTHRLEGGQLIIQRKYEFYYRQYMLYEVVPFFFIFVKDGFYVFIIYLFI